LAIQLHDKEREERAGTACGRYKRARGEGARGTERRGRVGIDRKGKRGEDRGRKERGETV
jgi:hypothetical protein